MFTGKCFCDKIFLKKLQTDIYKEYNSNHSDIIRKNNRKENSENEFTK